MFELLIWISIQMFWVTLFIGVPTLFGLRLFSVLKHKFRWKHALVVLFIPLSIGYYTHFKEPSLLKTWYQRCVLWTFISAFLGSIFILYIHLGLDII